MRMPRREASAWPARPFPGCDSQGDTADEALEMIKDAIKGHLAVAAKKKQKRVVA